MYLQSRPQGLAWATCIVLGSDIGKVVQAAPRLLAPGDTFAVALPPVGPVDGMLSTLSGSSLSAASTAGEPCRQVPASCKLRAGKPRS